MAHDIKIAGITYSDVPGVAVPLAAGGGSAFYLDADGYVTLNTSQTISGAKTFLQSVRTDNEQTGNAAHSLGYGCNSDGKAGIWDYTHSRWLILNDSGGTTTLADGAVTITSGLTVSGGMVVSGGITGSCTSAGSAANATDASSLGGVAAASYALNADVVQLSGNQTISGAKTFAEDIKVQHTGNVRFITSNTSSTRAIDLRTQDNGNAGIWDTENNRWMIHTYSNNTTEIVSGLNVTGDVTAPSVTITGAHTGPTTPGLLISGAGLGYAMQFQNANVTKGTTPTANQNAAIEFYGTKKDSYKDRIAWIETTVGSNGVNTLGLKVYGNAAADTTTNCILSVNVDSGGNAYTYAPTPTAGDSSTKIATTAFVRGATVASATNASSLGGVSAATYLRKDVSSQRITVDAGNALFDLVTSGGTYLRTLRIAAQANGKAGLYYNTGSVVGWLINVEPDGSLVTSATATNASSLGGVAASGYVTTSDLNTITSAAPTFYSGYGDFNAASKVMVYRNGHVCQVTGAARANVAASGTGSQNILTLPAGYRPIAQYTCIQQGSGQNRFLMSVTTGGDVKIERYGVTSAIAIGSGSWLNMACTFICA